MPATPSTRRKKPGLIRETASKVADLATAVGSTIGATVREPAAQIATFVHDAAQRLPVIGAAKRTRPKARPSPKAKSKTGSNPGAKPRSKPRSKQGARSRRRRAART